MKIQTKRLYRISGGWLHSREPVLVKAQSKHQALRIAQLYYKKDHCVAERIREKLLEVEEDKT